MINYNNLSFIHYLNLAFESTQRECRKFQSPFSAHSQLLYSWSHASYRKEGARYALSYDIETWTNHTFQTSSGFWLGFWLFFLLTTLSYSWWNWIQREILRSLLWWTRIRGVLQLYMLTAQNILTLQWPGSSSHRCIETHLNTRTYLCSRMFQYYLASYLISQASYCTFINQHDEKNQNVFV